MNIGKGLTVLVLFSVLLALPLVGRAADELKPEAREVFDKGMAAVEQQQWLVAIGYFERAQRIDESAPQVLFNLGVAESKIPGRELRSLAWFRAYLAQFPTAPNADAVRKECTRLEIKVEATVQKLAGEAKRFIPKLKGSGLETPPDRAINSGRSVVYGKVAEALAMAGDFAGARQTAGLVQDRSRLEQDYGCKNLGEPGWCDENRFDVQDTLLARIVEEQAEAGDVAGAAETLRLIKLKPVPGWRYPGVEEAYQALAVAQAKAGDFLGAQKTIEAIPEDKYEREFGLKEISRIKAGSAPQRKPDPSFLTGMFTGKFELFSRGPDIRKEFFTDLAEHLKKVAARQKLEDILGGYVDAITETAKALKVIKIGDPFVLADFY